MKILVCIVGSTSLKFKLYEMPACEVFAQGAVERVGSGRDAIVSYNNNHTGARVDLDGQDIPDYQTGIESGVDRRSTSRAFQRGRNRTRGI